MVDFPATTPLPARPDTPGKMGAIGKTGPRAFPFGGADRIGPGQPPAAAWAHAMQPYAPEEITPPMPVAGESRPDHAPAEELRSKTCLDAIAWVRALAPGRGRRSRRCPSASRGFPLSRRRAAAARSGARPQARSGPPSFAPVTPPTLHLDKNQNTSIAANGPRRTDAPGDLGIRIPPGASEFKWIT